MFYHLNADLKKVASSQSSGWGKFRNLGKFCSLNHNNQRVIFCYPNSRGARLGNLLKGLISSSFSYGLSRKKLSISSFYKGQFMRFWGKFGFMKMLLGESLIIFQGPTELDVEIIKWSALMCWEKCKKKSLPLSDVPFANLVTW